MTMILIKIFITVALGWLTIKVNDAAAAKIMKSAEFLMEDSSSNSGESVK